MRAPPLNALHYASYLELRTDNSLIKDPVSVASSEITEISSDHSCGYSPSDDLSVKLRYTIRSIETGVAQVTATFRGIRQPVQHSMCGMSIV